MMKCVAVFALLWGALAFNAEGKEIFMNCEKPAADFFSWFNPFAAQAQVTDTKICCTSNQLPMGCECFEVSEESGFVNSKGFLPQCPEHLGIQFYLYTRNNKNDPFMLHASDQSIPHSNFNASKPTKFVIHGFTDWTPSPWTLMLKNELLKADDVNVIMVNWHDGAIGFNFNFWRATANVRPTAAVIANLISVMKNEDGVKLKDVHLIGHSMGGEVSGMVGKEVFRLEGEKLGRISGMDAAGPGFEDFGVQCHIDKEDADFVDLYHTDTLNPGLGVKNPHGHVDFYFNDAQVMPGCPANPVTFEQMLNFAEGTLESVCSHGRAYEYYTTSINDCKFVSDDETKCPVGYHATPECTGKHNVVTTAEQPFCLH